MGGSESGESNPLFSVLASLTPEAKNADVIQARLAELGMSREELDEVLGVIAWERLPPAEKLAKLLTGNAIFDIPTDKLLVFIRELLMSHQFDDAMTLLERYAKGTEHESYFIRQTVCDTFAQTAMFIKEPGANPQIEQLLTRTILNTFVREPDARMRTTLGEAVANLATSLIATGRSELALRALTRLQTAVSVAPSDAAVHQAYESLWQALGDARRAGALIEQVCSVDNETLSKVVIPLVVHTGTAVAAHLIEALGNEEDRNRRGRLVRALKAIGKPAHPFLIEALHSPTWYVVRNTLNVLSDIGERDHVAEIGTRLQHGDARVRRAAARALGRIGGAESERLLAGAIYDRDAETQNEVFLCLASMKAVSAIPALIDVAKARRVGGDEKAREAAIHTIAQIGSPEAIPGLVEILRPKGIFARESLQVRVAAAKALSVINTPEAHQALQHAIETENDRNAKETFAKLLPQT
jgi:HEAT repeat protein